MACPGVVFVADEVKVVTGAGTMWLASAAAAKKRNADKMSDANFTLLIIALRCS